MEGRGVFVNVKKRKEEKEENYQEYCQRREQEEKVRKEKEKLNKEKEKKERFEQSFSCWAESSPKAKYGERLQMPSFHSSFRNRKEDEWIDGFMRGLESEQIIAEVMSEVIDASASRPSMCNEK